MLRIFYGGLFKNEDNTNNEATKERSTDYNTLLTPSDKNYSHENISKTKSILFSTK